VLSLFSHSFFFALRFFLRSFSSHFLSQCNQFRNLQEKLPPHIVMTSVAYIQDQVPRKSISFKVPVFLDNAYYPHSTGWAKSGGGSVSLEVDLFPLLIDFSLT
jgi:hypothetical protein